MSTDKNENPLEQINKKLKDLNDKMENIENIIHNEEKEQFLLIEGVMIGIYGNFLINFLENVIIANSFWVSLLQYLLMLGSIGSLLLPFIYKLHLFSTYKLWLYTATHPTLTILSKMLEMGFKATDLMRFQSIGFFLWIVIFLFEYVRKRDRSIISSA